MVTFQNYIIKEKLYDSPSSLVYRAGRSRDGSPVVIKALREGFPSPTDVARYRWEYEISARLKIEGTPEVVELTEMDHRPAIIFKDFGGVDLRKLLEGKTLTMTEKLRLAAASARILDDIHTAGFIHTDIKPSNIVYNPDTGFTEIIDFGSAKEARRRGSETESSRMLHGTHPYMSPEHTGRMNRVVDWRSDLYSFGVALYELFTGRLPFETDDLLEMVHAHIARIPRAPHEIDDHFPRVLSDLIGKLLAKNPEDRYQSGRGVQADLDKCLASYESSGKIHYFPLAQKDVSARFSISPRIYGRTEEKERLLSAYQRAAGGGREMVLVQGPAGIGKTNLVLDIERTVAGEKGTFIYGRFDSYGTDAPYSAMLEALKELVRRILTEGQHGLSKWRERLEAALGPNIRIIADLIPETEMIFGEQPPVETLEPAAAQARKQRALCRFLGVFCRPENPLVLFLDQFQLADSASLDLITSCLENEAFEFFCVIAAFRGNSGSLIEWPEKTAPILREKAFKITKIELGPLDKERVARLAADTFHTATVRIEPLAGLLWKKTGGNPFFVKEFLRTLYQEKMVVFDHANGWWTWDLPQIEAQDYTDNVIDFMADNVKKLPPGIREVLGPASAMGGGFDLRILSALSGRPPDETARLLKEAEILGLVIPSRSKRRPIETDACYRFSHDRIQQAVYLLIPDDERPALHYRLGKIMLEHTDPALREERIGQIVSHLNRALELMVEEPERLSLCRLNLEAARRAKATGSFPIALNYARTGLALARDDWWSEEYTLMMSLHIEAMEAAYLSGRYDEMESLGKKALSRAETTLDKVRLLQVRIEARLTRNHWPEAARLGLKALELLGINPPDTSRCVCQLVAKQNVQSLLAGHSMEEILDLPPMTDPVSLAAMRIMTRAAPAFNSVYPDKAPLILARQIELSLHKGNAPTSPLAYVNAAALLCGQGEIDQGYRLGQTALKLAKHSKAGEHEAAVRFIFNFVVRHWKEHLDQTLAPLLEVHQACRDTDLVFQGVYALVYRAVHFFLLGRPLPEVDRQLEECGRIVDEMGQIDARDFVLMFRQVIANLSGQSDNPLEIKGDLYDEEIMLNRESQADNRGRDIGLLFNKLFLNLLFGNHSGAVTYADRLADSIEFMSSMTFAPICHFGEALARLSLLKETDSEQKKIHLERIEKCQENLDRWNLNAPMNAAQKYLLVKAEQAGIEQRVSEAAELYDLAISAARENGYLQDEALANELAAGFYFQRGKTTIGRAYMMEAHYAYLNWGAVAKVRQLEENHPELYAKTVEKRDTPTISTPQTVSASLTDTDRGLDLVSAFKAAQAVSGEIVLQNLLDKLMNIVMENAGAQKSILIIDRDGNLTVEAAIYLGQACSSRSQSIPLEESTVAASAVVNFVARTKEPILLEDALTTGKFTREPYIIKNKVRSVLCLPLIHKQKLTGVLYLENNLAPGVFTPDRLDTLNWLASQAAISLENARLYQQSADHSRRLEDIISALNVAQEVQQSLLPRRPPDMEGVDISGRSLYCDQTGGDYYDYITLDGKKPPSLGVVIGDVSGHGVSSALLMSGIRAYLRSMTALSPTPAETITAVNRLVVADTIETGQFMTLFYLEIHPESRQMTWVRAGHDPALIYSPDSDSFEELGGSGLALGIENDWTYSQFTRKAAPGQIVVLATDGIWETHNQQGEMFGKERFKAIIRKNARLPAENIQQTVFDAVAEFRGNPPQDDDLTMVVIIFQN